MRLIDADKLKTYLSEYLHYDHAIPWVDAQPTAYDIDKVVEELEKLADESYKAYCIAFNSDDRAEYDAYINAIEIVKQETEQYNNGWIPCSERLPEYGEVVMCYCTNGVITISYITHRDEKQSKIVRFGQHSVIAWQPLPEPYQQK